ncbi:hypothetical protein ALC57_00171 [Trachymyrmex cornetzi]|uniref:RNA-directed DNA polymerase from mobile element jockey n=1 Tax=Trachymyrmex cornetzi TaxID=471704 RepID=A0A151K3F9_9HYME|nr:hypothetical protein ALC57_00171 [Trachymyrmex cornetzi]
MKATVETVERINDDVEYIVDWATENQFLLNGAKTRAIIVVTTLYIIFIDFDALPNIMVAETSVRFVSEVKYLGTVISSNLSWDKHVNNVTKKIRMVLYQLKLCRHLMPESLRIRLAITLVLPHLDYRCATLKDITGTGH